MLVQARLIYRQQEYKSNKYTLDIHNKKMSLILNKYRNKRRLGGGAFGDVQLVSDSENNEYALKLISKKIILKEPYMEQYIEGQKDCMMSLKSPYVVRLYDVEEDANYKYFLCEFCDGGDLLNLQSKQPNKVFSMKDAVKILSQVILGLEHVHRKGYLHRDIKLQNILVKKGPKENTFKLADFGFSKRVQNVNGTVLGTQNYMSPEIYLNEIYGHQVDMWAFGVLFYFMLNMEFPFTFVNCHSDPERKRQELMRQAKDFSYAAKVKQSAKKIMENCTPEIEDLFKKMFNINPAKRINFAQIREHPVFKEYFPNPDKELYKVYQVNLPRDFESYRQGKISGIEKKGEKTVQKYIISGGSTAENDSEIDISPSCFLKKPKTSPQNQVVQLEHQRIQFLREAVEQLSFNVSFVQREEILAFRYNVYKYYVILLRELSNNLNAGAYSKKYPKLSWQNYFGSAEAKETKQQILTSLDEAQMKVSQAYDQCKTSYPKIKQLNPKLESIFEREVSENEFTGALKSSYRCSTSGLYNKLRQKANTNVQYTYLTLLILMIHAFNNIVRTSDADLGKIFVEFEKIGHGGLIDFRVLKGWLSGLDKNKLKQMIVEINKAYFS